MSRQKYPRHDSTRRFKPTDSNPGNTPKMCNAAGCAKPATAFTFIQFTYMRGEDEGVQHCDDHGLPSAEHRDPIAVSAWCRLFPPGAWK